MLTRRCTQRQFLLRPDPKLEQLYLYVLGLAAMRTGVDLIHATLMSNHEHLVLGDRGATRVAFYQYLHALVARAGNCLRGRFENLWDTAQTSVVRLVTGDDLVDKIVYAATNPVTARLVARVDQWPGVNTLRALLDKQPIVVKRPHWFFSDRMPDEVTLHFRLPPEVGDEDEVLDRIRRRIAEVEEAEAARRAQTGARVLGRRAVRKQSWRDRPRTREPRFGLRPQVACRNRWARIEALQRNRDFLEAYSEARRLWLAGKPTLFPPGTYQLRCFAFVPVAEPPIIPFGPASN